jgi:hypothetical protein
MGYCVGEKALNSNLSPNLGLAKKTPLISFSNCLLENAWVESAFPYALPPCHEVTKWDTIGVIIGTNAKLPHHKDLTLTYQMENETPFVHLVVKWQGWNYTIENDENSNERTQGNPKTKPKSNLMHARWERGKVLSSDGHGGWD